MLNFKKDILFKLNKRQVIDADHFKDFLADLYSQQASVSDYPQGPAKADNHDIGLQQRKKQREKFEAQFQLLVERIKTLTLSLNIPQAIVNNLDAFAKNVFNPQFTGNQNSIYFSDIKRYLEEIVFYLSNESYQQQFTPAYKTKVMTDFLQDLVVCGPGVFMHIQTAHESLTKSDSLIYTLSEMRKEIVRTYAARHAAIKQLETGNQIHAYLVFAQYAHNEGWGIVGGEELKRIDDPFITHAQISDIDIKNFHRTFSKKYSSAKIFNNLFIQLTTKLNEIARKHGITEKSFCAEKLTTAFYNELTRFLQAWFEDPELNAHDYLDKSDDSYQLSNPMLKAKLYATLSASNIRPIKLTDEVTLFYLEGQLFHSSVELDNGGHVPLVDYIGSNIMGDDNDAAIWPEPLVKILIEQGCSNIRLSDANFYKFYNLGVRRYHNAVFTQIDLRSIELRSLELTSITFEDVYFAQDTKASDFANMSTLNFSDTCLIGDKTIFDCVCQEAHPFALACLASNTTYSEQDYLLLLKMAIHYQHPNEVLSALNIDAFQLIKLLNMLSEKERHFLSLAKIYWATWVHSEYEFKQLLPFILAEGSIAVAETLENFFFRKDADDQTAVAQYLYLLKAIPLKDRLHVYTYFFKTTLTPTSKAILNKARALDIYAVLCHDMPVEEKVKHLKRLLPYLQTIINQFPNGHELAKFIKSASAAEIAVVVSAKVLDSCIKNWQELIAVAKSLPDDLRAKYLIPKLMQTKLQTVDGLVALLTNLPADSKLVPVTSIVSIVENVAILIEFIDKLPEQHLAKLLDLGLLEPYIKTTSGLAILVGTLAKNGSNFYKLQSILATKLAGSVIKDMEELTTFIEQLKPYMADFKVANGLIKSYIKTFDDAIKLVEHFARTSDFALFKFVFNECQPFITSLSKLAKMAKVINTANSFTMKHWGPYFFTYELIAVLLLLDRKQSDYSAFSYIWEICTKLNDKDAKSLLKDIQMHSVNEWWQLHSLLLAMPKSQRSNFLQADKARQLIDGHQKFIKLLEELPHKDRSKWLKLCKRSWIKNENDLNELTRLFDSNLDIRLDANMRFIFDSPNLAKNSTNKTLKMATEYTAAKIKPDFSRQFRDQSLQAIYDPLLTYATNRQARNGYSLTYFMRSSSLSPAKAMFIHWVGYQLQHIEKISRREVRIQALEDLNKLLQNVINQPSAITATRRGNSQYCLTSAIKEVRTQIDRQLTIETRARVPRHAV